MAGDKFDQLYNALKADGAVSGTREHFRQFVYAPGKQGYHNRKQLYDALHADGAVSSKSYEEFAQRLGLHAVNPKPQQQKPLTMKQRAQKVAAQYQQTKLFEQPKYQQIKPLAQNKPQQPVDYLHRPHNQMGRARRNVPENASPFVRSLYEIDNAKKGPDYSVDYTSPKATQQVYKQNQQVRKQAAQSAIDHVANDEYRRQSRPMIDNGTVGVMKPMGEIEQEMSDSASKFVDANLGDYISKAVLGEQNASAQRGLDASNRVPLQAGAGGMGLMVKGMAYNEQVDPDLMAKNLTDNARNGFLKLFQDPNFVAKMENEATRLGVTPEAYMESIIPHLKDRLATSLHESEYQKALPKNMLDNIANRFIDSNTIGKALRLATQTRGQRILNEQASAATAEGKNPYYKGGTVENVTADVAGMVADPIFGASAKLGGAVAGKLIGNSTKLAALMANGNLAQRLMARGAQAVTSGGVTGFVFDSTGSVIQNYSTGEDTSLGNTLKVAAKGGATGAVNFATMSLAGIPLSEVGRSVGLKAIKGGSFWGNAGRATAKVGLESGKTYMEAMGMYLGGYVSGKLEGRTDANGKPIEFDLWNGTMESLPTAIGFRLQHAIGGLKGGRKNEKGEDMGWFGSTLANFKDFVTSDKAKESRFLMTEDERNQIFSSGAMNGLMPDGENIVSYAKRTKNKKVSYEDPYLETDASMIKNTYDQIMADPKVSWDAKAKFSAMVTGIMPSARPMMDYITYSSEDYVKDGLLRGKRKYVNEYSAKGELLSKIPYDNKVDRDNVVYKHNIVRENQRLYNAMGLLARQDRNNYELQNDFFVENMKKPGADVNKLVTNMGNEGSDVFRDFSLFALNSEKGTVMNTIDSVAVRNGMKSEDLIKAMKKDPMKRTDFEQNLCVELRRSLEAKAFPDGKVHVEQSNLNGKDVAEDNNLGTEQPNGEAVKQELNGLRQAEAEMDALIRDNDIFSQNFKKLQSQGLTNPQIYDWMVQQGGLTVEQLTPFAHYINANARVQGMQEATKQKIEETVSVFAQDWSYHGTLNGQAMNGEQALYVQDSSGRTLLVGSGDVAFDQTTGRAKEGSGDMLVCLDPNTKEMVYVKADEVTLVQNQHIDQFAAEYRQRLQMKNSEPYNQAAQEQAMQDAAENQDQSESGKGNDASETPEIVSEATPVETPTDFSFNNGKGRIKSYKATPHEKTKSDGTKEITFSSEVTYTKGAPKGHKEGEVRNIGNGGGFIKIDPIDIDYQQYAVYDRLHDDGTAFSKDEATSEDIAEAKELIDTLLTPQLAEEMGPQYNVNKIIIAPDGRVFAKFIGMDGNIPLKRNPLEKAPQDDTTKSEDNTTKEGNLTKDDTNLTKDDTNLTKDDTTNEDLVPQEQPKPSRKFADGSDVPMATDSKGRPTPDYGKMTPEQSAEILTEDFGENAEKVVDGQIQKAEKALKDAEKMKVDYTAEPNDIMEQEALKTKTVEDAKKQLDHAQNIKKAMTAKKVAETVGKTEQTEGAHEAGVVSPKVKERFDASKKIKGRRGSITLADGTKIRGTYYYGETSGLTTSHDPFNDFKQSEGFPVNEDGTSSNSRSYRDKESRLFTQKIGNDFNGLALKNVPVVQEGITLSGNGTVMGKKLAEQAGKDSKYYEDLEDNAEGFGWTPEQIKGAGFKGIVYFVPDEKLPLNSKTFDLFNKKETKSESNTEQAVKNAKTLTSDEVGAIVAEIEGNGSLEAFFNNSKAINDLVKTLVDKGIIGQNEVAQMMDSPERLSAQGREYVKNLLLGSIFKPETIRMLGIDSMVKNKAINAIRSVMDNMKLGEFSLRDEIDQAIQLLYEARQGGNKVDTLLRTPDMFGEDAAKRYSSISQMMALALEGKVSDFRDLLDEYNRIAKARNTGEGSIFEEAPTKEELIKEFLDFKKWQDYGTGHSEIEGIHDVSGVEEPQQEASGGNEPAEAGEGRVKSDLDRITETDEEFEVEGKYGTIYKKKYLIDGDKEVMKVDEPNKNGDYTGSYYEYNGKKYGDLRGVFEHLDDKPDTGSEEMPEGPIYDRKKALIDEINESDIKKKDDAFQILYKAEDLLDDYYGIPHDEWRQEPSRSNTITGILSMARNMLDRIENEPVEPASERQLAFLESLTKDDPTTRDQLEGVELNKRQASWLIGRIKGLDDNLMSLHPDDIAEAEKEIHDGIEYMKKMNGETSDEGGLPLLPNEEKPDPKFNPIEAAAAEFKKEHPLTEEEIMKADVDDVVKDMALDYLNGEVTDDLHRAIYESIFVKTRDKVKTSESIPSVEQSVSSGETDSSIVRNENKPQNNEVKGSEKEETNVKNDVKTADDAAVVASNKKVNDLWKELMNAGKDELSASFVGLNSKQLELLPKLVGAMAENAYLRIKRGMHNLEDVVKEMRKEFAPAAKVFKKEDVDAIYEQMMNIRYRDGEQRMSLKEWADYYEKTSPKHQENLVGDSKSAEERKQTEKKFIDAVKLQLAFGRKFKSIMELRKMAERLGLKDIKDTDLQELTETAIVQRARSIASSEATSDAEKFKRIKNLYENQPGLNQRDSERVMKGQFSTPAPYAYLADMYVNGNGKVIESALEPSAGNGMLTIGLPMDKVHVNDIDAQRLANLRRQGFKNVTSQDGTQPFADKDVDVVVTNPPFGSATTKEYDGYKISSLEGQMAINALDSMKDDGRAAIIIGGKTEYAKNGSLKPKDKAFLGYLYSHYNVEDVINVDGSLFAKQGTTIPTRIILINGRRNYDPEHKVFPPVEKDARAETVKDYDELYKRIEDDILRSTEQPVDIRRKEKREGDKPSGRKNVSDSTEENGGRGRLGTTTVHDGTSENSEPTELDPSTRPVGQSEDADGRPVEATGNGDSNTDGRGGQNSVSKSGPADGGSERGRNEPSGGNEPLRNDNGENGREPGVRHGSGHIQQQLENTPKEEKKQSLTTEKVKYQPHSAAYSIGAVVPARQKEALDNVLNKLGDADQYLVDNLGYNDKEDLYAHLAAEQIDAVALGLKQMEKGNGFIIGDQTGIGKGRQAAAIIRYAVKQGRIPVSFTQKANLFSDTYRDLNDIGSPELRPFILASSNDGNIKVNYDEEVKGLDGQTTTVRKQKVVYKVPSKTETERVLKYIAENGKLPEGYDYILTTYSQIRNGMEEFKGGKWKAKKKVTATGRNGQMKRDAIKRIAENSVFILDESHDAAGEGSGSAFIQEVLPKVKGVIFLSATYAKTPDAMKLYALKTDLGSKNKEEGEKGDASWKVLNAIKKGGAVFQEIMSQALTKSGQMIRRERDMTGVTIDWNPLTENEVEIQSQRDKFDNIFGIFNDILNFQRTYVDAKLGQMSDDLAFIQGSVDHTPGTKDMGIGNVTFASKAYNVVQQALFSIKAEKVADYAIEAIKNGEKPVIAVNNTMGSMIDEYPMGVEMDMPDLNSTLMKGLEGILRYTEKNDMGDQVNSTLRVEELGEEAVARYNEIKQKIASVSSGLSISPIDVIKHRLEEAGYKVGELTGRNTEMAYTENGKVIRKNRTDKNKNALADRFNNGDLDALILNRSAAAGISLHASSKYKDQRQRTMIFAQMQGNINDEVQIRGRIDRTGQVRRGKYVYLVSAIPAEQRLMMMFKNKLKSLDANTTSSQKSKFNEVDVQDFTNKYGDEIVLQYMAQHPEYYNKLADPLGWGFMEYAKDGLSIGELKSSMKSNITSPSYEVMKRLTLLPVKEQEVVLKDISDSYSQKIKQLNDMGMNDLEMTDMPLEAKTLKREVWKEGSDPDGDNAFADNTYIETVEMNVLKKPMKAEEVEAAQKKMLDGKDYETWRKDKVAEIRAHQQAKIEDTKAKMAEQTEKKVAKVEESTRIALERENAKIQKKIDKGEELKPGEHVLTEEEIKTRVDTAVDDVKRRLSKKLSDAIKNVNVKYDMFVNPLFAFDPNKTISVPNDWYVEEASTSLYPEFGRVIGFKYDKNYNLGSSSIVIATTDSRKRVEIPLNRTAVFERIQADSERFSKECKVVNMVAWNRMIPKKDRTTGRIITGNMLEALADNSSIGHLISYTTDDGKVKQGILVPDGVSIAEITGNMPIAKAYDWFTKKTSGTELASTDGTLRLTKNFGSMYTLFVPASRKEGGKYYLNQDLLDLVHGHNFQSKGKNFWATFDAEKLKDVLNVLNGMGVEVKTPYDYSESDTHFREDRGLQYSKTDTKDVKNSRIIPEDVDKNVSSQIEKSYDVEVNRLFGHYLSPNQKRFVDETANDYASRSLHDEYYVDEETKEKKTVRGLDSAYKFWNDKVTEFEQKYGINRNTDISRLEEESRKAFANSFGEGRNSGRSAEQTNRYQGKDGYSMGGTGSGRDKASLPTPEEIFGYQCDVLERESVLRAYRYHKERARILSEKYGIDSGGWIQPETIEKIFNDFNTDKNLKVLFDRIKDQVNDLDIYFGEVYGEEKGTDGFYRHDSFNDIRLNIDSLLTAARTRQDFASVILHEMLHPLTSDIIAMYQKGHADKLTKSQAEAAKNVVDIYNRLKSLYKEKGWKEPYALTNPREMMTELANPSWREALQGFEEGRSIWRKVLDSIRKFFGFAPTRPGLSDLNNALDNVLNNFGKEQFDFATRHYRELFGKEPQGHKVTDPEEIKRLEEEPKIKVYRAMQVIDGKLYPPMAAYADGKLVEANELGKWIKADEMPDSKNTVYKYKGTTTTIPKDRAVKGEDGIWRDSKNGAELAVGEDGNPTWYFKLQKGKGATGKKLTDVPAAYNPYWHTSYSPLNDQFKSAWIRPNVVVVECEVPAGELTSGYRAEHAKDPVGMTPWTSGVVTKQLVAKGHEGRKVMLSRWCKPVRIVPDEEVAAKIKDFIGDYDVEIPENVVTPRQKVELEKLGVKIGAPEKGMNKNEQIAEAIKLGLQVDNTVLSEDGTKFRTNHGDGNYPASSVESHVEKVAQKTGGKVKMVSSVDEITNKAAKAAVEEGRKITGWYDEKTGEVHLYMPNIHDRYTAEKTIWHEVVGHKGMRELFGEDRFEKFLRDVWYDLDKPENADLKKLVDEERKYNPLNIYDAIEEGIARLAEDGKGEAGFWNGIKNKVSDFLHEIGYRIAPNTKDVKYLIWLSKNLQKNQNDPYWKMRAEAVKYRLDHDRVPAVVAHDGMFYGNDGKVRSMDNLTKAEWNEATDGDIHLRTTPSAGTALDRYHRSLNEHGYMFTESYMDNMLSLKKLMNAIVPDKKIEDIASSENPYMLQNTMQGAMSDAAQMFERNVMKPLDKAMADVLDAFDGKKDDEKIRNFNLYMITKHGLERNRVFFVRDFLKKIRRDEKKKQDADMLEQSWYNDKEYLDNELRAGNIDLKEYYRQMDENIRNYFDADFEAGEHDYSGIHAIQEVEKSSDPYDDAEAIQSVMDSEAKMEGIRKGAVKDYWDKVKAATQYSINSDYKNGIISSELYGHVSNMFNWYVPLRKYDEATAEDVYGYITEVGDPKSYIGSTIMRARGHKYLSETNVLAQIGAMGNRAIKNGGMNAIRQAFARFARNNSNNNLITETSVWYEKDPMTGIVYERYPDIPEDATADEINQIVSDFNKDMKAKALQNLASKVYRRGSIGYKFQRAENKSQHIVDVKIAGRTHAFIINGNPRAAQALNGLLENSGAKGIMKPLSSISRMMAQLCTSYNPEFVMRNIMRDAEFASSNVTSKEGARYGALWAKYYAQLGLYNGASNISLKDFSGSTGLGLFAKYRNGTLDISNKVERYFKEFMENGGETGWVQIKNMKDWTKEYKKDVSTERSKLGKGGAALRDFFFGNLENVNEVAENIARFATYCTSRDSNRSIIRSVYDAKEVSTNFNRHGSGDAISSFKNGEMTGGKAAERWVYGFTASYLRHCSMFFNAGIQSTNLLMKNLKNHPVGTSINMLAIPFALGALAALGNNVLIASEDEKDRKGVKDPYGELPDYVRRNNLCIYKGNGEFVTIPLAIELRAFYGLGDLAAGLTFSPNVSGQKNPYFDAVGCMSQLVPVMDYLGNSSAGKEPLNETIKAITPSALSPFVEWEMNTDWKGAPIERRGDWNEDVPAWQRAYKGTPDGYMSLNKFVNAQTNEVAKGNEDMLGNSFLDMVTNPSMLNHYIGGLGGGAATFIERAIGVVKHGKDTETKDIPFLRSLLYTPSEQSSLQRTKSKWYNYKDEMEKMIANVDRLKSKNVPIEKRISNYSDYYRFQNSKDAAKVRVIELAEKQMKQWKKLRDKSSDTESINFANQNIDRIMMEAVDDLDKLN